MSTPEIGGDAAARVRERLSRQITFLPLDRVTSPPRGSSFTAWRDHWWAYVPDRGLLIYRQFPQADPSPQCNSDRRVVEMLTRRQYAGLWPDVDVIQVPLVLVADGPEPRDAGAR